MYSSVFLIRIVKGPLLSYVCFSEDRAKEIIKIHKESTTEKHSYKIISGFKIKRSEGFRFLETS